MTEINNPKEYCNDSQSGSQQLPPNLCNCTPNIIAGPNIALTPNEDGSVTISAVVTDTDTILNNPHFIPGAPAGFNRLSYDLFNKLTNTTITADYTYVDIPDQDIQTLSIAGNNLSISNGNTIPLPIDTVTNTIAGNTIATHTAVDGTVEDINETVTTLTDNGDGTFTYTSEDGSTTTIDTNITNVLDSAGNVMTSTVNGVADTAPIINSNVLSVDVNGDLISTVNGVASTPLDLGSVVVLCETPVTSPGQTIVIDPMSTHGVDVNDFGVAPVTCGGVYAGADTNSQLLPVFHDATGKLYVKGPADHTSGVAENGTLGSAGTFGTFYSSASILVVAPICRDIEITLHAAFLNDVWVDGIVQAELYITTPQTPALHLRSQFFLPSMWGTGGKVRSALQQHEHYISRLTAGTSFLFEAKNTVQEIIPLSNIWYGGTQTLFVHWTTK